MSAVDALAIQRPRFQMTDEFREAYVVQIQRQDYIQVRGLIVAMHQMRLGPLQTVMVQAPNDQNGNTAIFEARVWDPYLQQWWTAHGDASPKTVSNAKIAPHFIRIAETRAIGRVLRMAMGIDLLCIEELDGADAVETYTHDTGTNSQSNTQSSKEEKVAAAATQKAAGTASNGAANPNGPIQYETFAEIKKLVKQDQVVTKEELDAYLKEHFGVELVAKLKEGQAQQVLAWLKQVKSQKEQRAATAV